MCIKKNLEVIKNKFGYYDVIFAARTYCIKEISNDIWVWKPSFCKEWDNTRHIGQDGIISYLRQLEIRLYGGY